MNKYIFFVLGGLSVASVSYGAVSTFQDGLVVGGTSLTSGLLMEVEGKIGAQELCNESGVECSDVSSIFSVTSGGGITGSGSGGYLPKFSSGVNLGNSVIRQSNDGNIGIAVAGMANGDSQSSRLRVSGNLKVDSRHLYLGSQDLYGDNSIRLFFDSNHSTATGMAFRDAENTVYGHVYGDSNGTRFGLLDGDGQWAIRHVKDSNTRWSINNAHYMKLTTTGLRIGDSANAAVTLDVLGDASISGDIEASDFLYSSDMRLKKNIATVSGLDIITQLRGVSFDWINGGESSIGFIAQEVESVVPELVNTRDSDGFKSVKYANINAYLVEAVKEQQKMIEDQQRQIDELQALISEK